MKKPKKLEDIIDLANELIIACEEVVTDLSRSHSKRTREELGYSIHLLNAAITKAKSGLQ